MRLPDVQYDEMCDPSYSAPKHQTILDPVCSTAQCDRY